MSSTNLPITSTLVIKLVSRSRPVMIEVTRMPMLKWGSPQAIRVGKENQASLWY
ncbi:hypothetical protein D3C81_2235000 [compost metagenome]